MSHLEKLLLMHLQGAGMPMPEQEYRFAAQHVGMGPNIRARLLKAGLRDWRFDFCWPDIKFAVECEGGGYANGRHVRGVGFANDLQKYHMAMDLGYMIYRCDGALIKSGKALQLIERIVTVLRYNQGAERANLRSMWGWGRTSGRGTRQHFTS